MSAAAPSPRVGFVIGGVQKGGTTALASFLGRHPGVVLPERKEAHVFDAPAFDERWTPAEVDARYAEHFSADAPPAALHGDATPIYILHPRFIARIRRYNPAMRWILLLRHPVDRALSQYHMERRRDLERLPLWLALLAERRRLARHRDDFSADSPLRRHSYRLRGDYATQLDALYAAFPAEQVLLLRNGDLAREPAAVMARVHRFLGLDESRASGGFDSGSDPDAGEGEGDYARVFEGRYARWGVRSWRRRLLCWWWRDELARQRRYELDWSGR